jgi:acylphosphatase
VDGAAEVVLEGAPDSVEWIVRLCREGSRAAWVAQVETFAEDPEALRGFEVR